MRKKGEERCNDVSGGPSGSLTASGTKEEQRYIVE